VALAKRILDVTMMLSSKQQVILCQFQNMLGVFAQGDLALDDTGEVLH